MCTSREGAQNFQVHDSMGSFQVARHMDSHVIKVKSYLVQPCVKIDAIYCPIKGLWQVNLYALVISIVH